MAVTVRLNVSEFCNPLYLDQIERFNFYLLIIFLVFNCHLLFGQRLFKNVSECTWRNEKFSMPYPFGFLHQTNKNQICTHSKIHHDYLCIWCAKTNEIGYKDYLVITHIACIPKSIKCKKIGLMWKALYIFFNFHFERPIFYQR